jgi:hypothetical protein
MLLSLLFVIVFHSFVDILRINTPAYSYSRSIIILYLYRVINLMRYEDHQQHCSSKLDSLELVIIITRIIIILTDYYINTLQIIN